MEITGFSPTTKIRGGQQGLITDVNSISTATITGTDLKNGKSVTVLDPPGSSTPTRQWIGTTSKVNKQGTQCNVVALRQVMSPAGPGTPPPTEDPTPVSVTVGGATMNPDPSVYIGTPILLVTGNYVVQCQGTGTASDGHKYVWLQAVSTTTVKLANQNDTPQQWAFAAAANAAPGSYTIQNTSNNQYLNWSSSGVSLVESPGPGTTWQLTTMSDGMVYILVPGTAPQYLNGDTADKSVSLKSQPDEHNGTSWAVAPPPKPA
jgi:hypothetical protein